MLWWHTVEKQELQIWKEAGAPPSVTSSLSHCLLRVPDPCPVINASTDLLYKGQSGRRKNTEGRGKAGKERRKKGRKV